MVFNSLTFLVFFSVVLVVHHLPLPWRIKKFNLLVASYLFYAAWNPPFVILLWLSTVIDWLVARQISRQTIPQYRTTWLIVSLIVNLGVLGFFKYGEFLTHNWELLMAWLGIPYHVVTWNILLPVGISFYTFHSMSYTLDVYWKRTQPIATLFDFALFVAFFTQLVAGPILRTSDLVPQFASPRTATRNQLCWGLALMTLGLFEKVVLADGVFAPTSDMVFEAGHALNRCDAIVGTLAFSGQIFCDFAGYSTIAIGTAMSLGFSIPNNFHSPYSAIGLSEFWRRWHISLSTWLRDYLYIPLGGNRKGKMRTYVNLMLTMLIGGLWHGANWTFVAWGGLHGMCLVFERLFKPALRRTYRWNLPVVRLLSAVLTFLVVTVAWIPFRAKTFSSALQVLDSIVAPHIRSSPVLPTIKIAETAVCIVGIWAAQWYMRERSLEEAVSRTPPLLVTTTLAAMACSIIIAQGTGDAFIYFQF